MKNTRFTLLSATVLLSTSVMVGCGDKTAEQSATQQSGRTSESDHGHPHDGEGDHDDSHKVEGHAHGAGPHDGTIADWGGGKYHCEFTVDHDKKEATVYVLGSDEKTATPIAAESILLTIKEPSMQVDLQPVPMEGEANGKSSRFAGTHDGLATVMEYEGTMSAVVDGTPYAGNFKEEPHAHEDE